MTTTHADVRPQPLRQDTRHMLTYAPPPPPVVLTQLAPRLPGRYDAHAHETATP